MLSPIVRNCQSADKDNLKELLEPLKDHYTDFDTWLDKTLNDSQAHINVASIESEAIGATAIWKLKDRATAKLSLFYIAPENRTIGLGQHLLFYCIREWIENRVTKVIVTISDENADLLTFFLRYDFRIEGISQRRYQRASGNISAEIILAKHFFYKRVTESDVNGFINELSETVFSVPNNQNIIDNNNWFVAPQNNFVKATFDKTNNSMILSNHEDQKVNTFSIYDLEKLFYPVRFAFNDRVAFLVPIQQNWADRMIQARNPVTDSNDYTYDRLFLRTDNVYYCHPWHTEIDVVGAPILFYISGPESIIAGIGYILERRIGSPEELFSEFKGLGIYQQNDIERHTKQTGTNLGCAMALKFGWWVQFKNPIPLSRLNEFDINGAPQHMQKIKYEQYENILREGGLEW